MPVPAPNLYPAFNVVRVSHAELIVTDLDASRAFYADTLGLQVTFQDSEIICLRAMEERGHHCLVLRRGAVSCRGVIQQGGSCSHTRVCFAGRDRSASAIRPPAHGRSAPLTAGQPHAGTRTARHIHMTLV